jgi:hypothetical protein
MAKCRRPVDDTIAVLAALNEPNHTPESQRLILHLWTDDGEARPTAFQ